METWAHGLDIADALGVQLVPTDRLRHVARLGVRTRDHSFAAHGLPVPDAPFRVELTVGESAAQWLSIAQAFAGPPGSGRAARGR